MVRVGVLQVGIGPIEPVNRGLLNHKLLWRDLVYREVVLFDGKLF